MKKTPGWLFVDMNAFFASVEQQERPKWRGRPVAVVPTDVGTSCCIAASYEAKLFGVKTGTGIDEARRLCPQIRIVEADPALYRAYHGAIVAAVESCIPVTEVLSIDEMACQLWENERDLYKALRLGAQIQARIAREVGEWMSCSVGIGPNPFLAKVAGDFQKPRGLSVIDYEDIPRKVLHLRLTDWPGISRRMEARYHAAGVASTESMYALTPRAMIRIYGGVVGERWWRQLRGETVSLPPTKRGQFGHSMVLPPEKRTAGGARSVAARLLERAAERMRYQGFCARSLHVSCSAYDDPGWRDRLIFEPSRDTAFFLYALNRLWRDDIRRPSFAAVSLGSVVESINVTQSMFEDPRITALTNVSDAINRRFGRGAIVSAAALRGGDGMQERIPFGAIDPLLTAPTGRWA